MLIGGEWRAASELRSARSLSRRRGVARAALSLAELDDALNAAVQ